MDNYPYFRNKAFILLFYHIKDNKGREHTRWGADVFYILRDELCTSYLDIYNSHTHTYLVDSYN